MKPAPDVIYKLELVWLSTCNSIRSLFLILNSLWMINIQCHVMCFAQLADGEASWVHRSQSCCPGRGKRRWDCTYFPCHKSQNVWGLKRLKMCNRFVYLQLQGCVHKVSWNYSSTLLLRIWRSWVMTQLPHNMHLQYQIWLDCCHSRMWCVNWQHQKTDKKSLIQFIFTIAATCPFITCCCLDGNKHHTLRCDFPTKPLHRNKVQNNMLQ